MPKSYRNSSKTSKAPKRPFEKERIESEIKIAGTHGLKNKREIWRVQLTIAKLRKAARALLTLNEQDPKRIFEGQAILNRMYKYGFLNASTQNQIDYILGLNTEVFMSRRLQTIVKKIKLANSIHEARTKIRHRHISVNNQLVNVPSYLVTCENEARIQHHSMSCYGGGKPGRWSKGKKATGGADE